MERYTCCGLYTYKSVKKINRVIKYSFEYIKGSIFYILRFWLRNREMRYVKKTVEFSQIVDYEERQKGLS